MLLLRQCRRTQVHFIHATLTEHLRCAMMVLKGEVKWPKLCLRSRSRDLLVSHGVDGPRGKGQKWTQSGAPGWLSC